jgi:diacylglycerol kinase family enzyme
MDQLLVIYHEQAGGSTAETRASVVERLRAEADVVVEGVENEADLRRVLDWHRERRPVVLGGDGSFHALVAALHALGRTGGHTPPVGLVPLGTGNDLARSLGLPLEPVAATQVVLHGSPRAIDVLVDDAGGVAVNAVHLGVGAEAAEQAAPLKGGLGRLAYPIGAVLAGIRGRGWRVRVNVDGRVVAGGRQRVLMVGLANGARIGGGAPLAPGARPDDGLVDVLVSFSTSLPARLIYGALLRRGQHPRLRDVVTMRGREIAVLGEPVPINVDGEIGAPITERRWSVTPAAVQVMVPADE